MFLEDYGIIIIVAKGKKIFFFFLPFLNKFSSLKGVVGDVATKENMYPF